MLAFFWVRHLTLFFQLLLISWMVTLISCLIWQIISFNLPPNGITLKMMVTLQNMCENSVRILQEEKHRHLCMFVILWKKSKKLTSSEILRQIDLQKMPILAKKVIFSDEAHFDLGGYVNKQSCRIWGTQKSHACLKKPTHLKRITVWCGFWSRGIIGPNGNRYRAMLNEFLFTKIEEEDIANIWFQQDYVPHSRSYNLYFAPCFCRSHYQPQSWCRLGTSELLFDTVGLLFVWCRQR